MSDLEHTSAINVGSYLDLRYELATLEQDIKSLEVNVKIGKESERALLDYYKREAELIEELQRRRDNA